MTAVMLSTMVLCFAFTVSVAVSIGLASILGIQATYEGLRIDPCIPHGWAGFRATRKFRGAVYQIEVHNPDGVCKGVRSVTVDGHEIQGNVVPLLKGGRTHHIQVIMGQ